MSNQKKNTFDSPIGFNDSGISYKDKSQKYSTKNLQDYKDHINENFKVVVRVRPPLPRELTGDQFVSTVNTNSMVFKNQKKYIDSS